MRGKEILRTRIIDIYIENILILIVFIILTRAYNSNYLVQVISLDTYFSFIQNTEISIIDKFNISQFILINILVASLIIAVLFSLNPIKNISLILNNHPFKVLEIKRPDYQSLKFFILFSPFIIFPFSVIFSIVFNQRIEIPLDFRM